MGGGGGGGGGDSSSGGGGGAAAAGGLVMWKGWQDRVAADPQFVYKVLVEQIIGVGASVAGDMAGRPNWGRDELDFVFATLIVGSFVNFSLMYLLAPTGAAAAGAKAAGPIARLFSEAPLRALGAPGGHMFQPGFPLGKRAINFAYKGGLFAVIGMAAGLAGTVVSNGLLLARKALDPSFVTQNESPNVAANAACWAAHMGVSSNLRYQMLNGLDMAVQPVLPPAAFRLGTVVLRTVNNAIGGVSFVMIAKLFGVQKSAEAAAPVAAKGKGKTGGKK